MDFELKPYEFSQVDLNIPMALRRTRALENTCYQTTVDLLTDVSVTRENPVTNTLLSVASLHCANWPFVFTSLTQ